MATRIPASMIDGVDLISGGARGFLSGLRLSNSPGDVDHDIQIAAGTCRDIADTRKLSMLAPITKRVDAAWSAGDDGGGLDAGSIAANSSYHAHVIGGDAVAEDVIFSTSPVNPALPPGYTVSRRIGAIVTDASANIRLFLQTGGWFHYMMGVTAADNLAVGLSQALELPVPKGVKLFAEFIVVPQSSSGGGNSFFMVKDPDLGFLSDSASVTNFASSPATTQVLCWTSAIGRVNVGSTNGGTFSAFVRGWYDDREMNT